MPSFLRRLSGRIAPVAIAIEATIFPGAETLEVVGEARHQDELWDIVGGFRRDPVRHRVDAVLLPEPTNPVDQNAIQVLVAGRPVGYLPRDDAAAYLPGLLRLMSACETGRVALEGQIVGGGPRGNRVGFLGVFLDHDPADFGVPPHYTIGGNLRTGLSDAIATDLQDESYDLSWLSTLSNDNHVAAEQLRSLLENEHDPIDRHYMLCELEARLYRARNDQPLALDEFDKTCVWHHDEMVTLRPALLEKFGVVPVIEMYRQASIRFQKAKDWDAVRDWAQRGLEIYVEQAARPEVIEDLHKRLAHAIAKIESSTEPRASRPQAVTVTATARRSEIETLECASCGGSFERERTRGRKPRTCPTCRELVARVPSP